MDNKQTAVPHVEAIVIGASAGGVEAFLTVLEGVPANFPAAILAVLHLPADQPSALASILSYRCALKVKEAEDKETIQPGTVYLAPPDYHLLVEPERTVALSQDDPVHYSRPAIDLLFESAALTYREHLLGIVLTGANEDGSAGLAAIKEAGGTTWVQEPQGATASVMPQSAIDAVQPDCILTLQQIAQRLIQLAGPLTS